MTREKTVIALALAMWLGGAASLVLKGVALLRAAHRMDEAATEPLVALAIGVVVGAVKARFIMARSAHKNIARIRALSRPQAWQFFSGRFFIALAAMIAAGVTMSGLAAGHFGWLCVVGGVDMSIGMALLLSSFVYLPALRQTSPPLS